MKVRTENFSELYNLNLPSAVLTILTGIHFNNLFPLLTTVKQQFDFRFKKTINYLSLINTFPVEMATLRNRRKLAALNKENSEEHARSKLAKNSNVPRSQEDYTTQVSAEIEGRVTKKLSQEFSRTENRILGALARFDDFHINPIIRGHSGTTPETSQNLFITSQGTKEGVSQSYSHTEAGIFNNKTKQISGPEDGHDRGIFA